MPYPSQKRRTRVPSANILKRVESRPASVSSHHRSSESEAVQRRHIARLFGGTAQRQQKPSAASLLALQRLVGNRATNRLLRDRDVTLQRSPANARVQPSSTADPIQRSITIDKTSYPPGNPRHLRRELMLTLAHLDFPEKGTARMWEQVEAWLADGANHRFNDLREMVAELYRRGLMEKRMIAGAHMGPRNLGNRPNFATGVTNLLELPAGESQARRHVISSSSLGRAIETAPGTLNLLNEWLRRHGLPVHQDSGSPLDQRNARRAIWEHVHNHLGNLWIGDSMPNSAIGFIRGPILTAVNRIRDHMAKHDSDTVPLAEIVNHLPAESPWRNPLFSNTWNNIRATLIAQLTSQATLTGEVDGVSAVAEMVEWIRNADVDLPHLGMSEGYFERLSNIYGRLLFPTEELFAPNGTLDNFLQLTLAASPSGTSKSSSSSEDFSGGKSFSFGSAHIPEFIRGVGRIQNVSGDGMNCLIRSLLLAYGRPAPDSVVEILRAYLHGQGVAEQADMLELAGEAGAVLISYMVAQRLVDGNRGLVVYTPQHPVHPIVVLGGANPIALWLSDNHFRAIIPGPTPLDANPQQFGSSSSSGSSSGGDKMDISK